MKTEKYEFYHQSNLIQIGNLIDDLHSVHVHLLMLQRRYYRLSGKYASFGRICNHIRKLKARTKPHWNQLPSQVIQQVAKRIHLGYEAFFDNIKDRKAGKTKRKVGRPKIEPNHKYNSLTFTQAGFKIEENRLTINCLRTYANLTNNVAFFYSNPLNPPYQGDFKRKCVSLMSKKVLHVLEAPRLDWVYQNCHNQA